VLKAMLSGKIHCARVTETQLHYEGSVTIDKTLMDAAGIVADERVTVANMSNGERAETYVIEGKASRGDICLNGAAARLFAVGDEVIILSYALCTEEEARKLKPRIVIVNEKNEIVRQTTH